MSLLAGTRLGPYEIIAPLGAGGMGEVYRARDTRLGREVAVKVLPQHLSLNQEVRLRFEREAKTVSGLNHPNICTLFDIGREGETDYIVMELIAGETLAARLVHGPLPNAEALKTAIEIATALDRAHRAGVVHRDLKPGNVMLTKSGAKLMDFGLARPGGAASPSGFAATVAAPASPPHGAPLTAEGTILGTFQYMAPEQLEGKEADTRSDIWAFGCLLYEMTTGRHAFEGRSQASLIAAILERWPAGLEDSPTSSSSISVLGAPHGMQRLIRNCLAKDPDDRIQTAHDVKLQLETIAEGASYSVSGAGARAAEAPATEARPRSKAALVPWGVAAVGLFAAAGVFAWLYPKANQTEAAFRFQVGAISGTRDAFWPRISPDGRYLVIDATDSTGTVRAYVRPLDQIEAHVIPGTEGLRRAYWSPDSREIAFVAEDRIQRVPIAGGSPTVVCAAPGGADVSWGSKGSILMDGNPTDSLRVVPAGGGELRPATRIDRAANEIGSAWPHFLPDGEHFLFIGSLDRAGNTGNIRLGKLGSLDSKLLGQSDGRVEYAPGGWVLFLRGSTLLAQKIDLGGGKLTGQPITIAEEVSIGGSQGHFSISHTGVLAYLRGAVGQATPMYRADRKGTLLGEPLLTGIVGDPEPSPDGSRLLYVRSTGVAGGSGEAHVLDLERGTDTRLTFTSGIANTPVWAPDGRRFAYVTRPAGAAGSIIVGSADGLGVQDSIPLAKGLNASLSQWTPDGSQLIFTDAVSEPFFVPLAGADRSPKQQTGVGQPMIQNQISSDGRWIVGTAGFFPNVQVFVRSLGGQPGQWQISPSGGRHPRWTKGGRELLYEFGDRQLMAVDIEAGETFRAGISKLLFELPQGSFSFESPSWSCDAAGERFYLIVPPRTQARTSIEVASGFEKMVSRK
jgi:Tol biopolymer transport system component